MFPPNFLKPKTKHKNKQCFSFCQNSGFLVVLDKNANNTHWQKMTDSSRRSSRRGSRYLYYFIYIWFKINLIFKYMKQIAHSRLDKLKTSTYIYIYILIHCNLFIFLCWSSQTESEELVVIREVYDNDNAQEIFEVELEKAIQVNKVFNCGQLHLCTNFMIVISRNLLHGFEIHKHRALLKGSTGKK